MTNNNLGRRFSLSGSGEALFWLSFFPDEIGTGPGLKFDLFLLKHVLMPWTAVAIAIGVGLTGRGLPRPWLAQRSAHPSPRPHGDTPGKAVPRIAIKREHPDEISTKLSISCFVGHYPHFPPCISPIIRRPAEETHPLSFWSRQRQENDGTVPGGASTD